jgi:hypothetical protein
MSHCQVPQEINGCNETMFIFPITETEIKVLIKKYKGKQFCRH